MAVFLALLVAGSIVYIQDRTNAANHIIVEVSTNTDSGSYVTLGINNVVLEGAEPTQNTQIAVVVVQ
jgi:hypothetical protein